MPQEVLHPLLSGCVTRRVISDAAFDAFHQVSLQRLRDDRMRVDFPYEPKVEVTVVIPHWGYKRIRNRVLPGVGGDVSGILGNDLIWDLVVDFCPARSNTQCCRWSQL